MKGLYQKYIVLRNRGEDSQPELVPEMCFVLIPATDLAARAALLRYAQATDNEDLGDEIIEWLETFK